MMLLGKYIKAIGLAVTLAALAGCSSKPDDAMAIKHISEHDKRDGAYHPANVVRKNGWEEGAGGYKVEYTYDWVADADYADVVLAAAQKIEKDPNYFSDNPIGYATLTDAALNENPGGLFSGVAKFGLANDEDGRRMLDVGRRIREGAIDPKLVRYINEAASHDVKRQRMKYVLFSIPDLEGAGMKPETKKGQVIQNRYWTLMFRKTEKGWMLQ